MGRALAGLSLIAVVNGQLGLVRASASVDPVSDVAVTVVAPGSATISGGATVTGSVMNNGPDPAKGVKVHLDAVGQAGVVTTDTPGFGLAATCSPSAGSATAYDCALSADLAPGGTVPFSLVVHSTNAQTIDATSTVSSSSIDNQPGNDTATVHVPIAGPWADLSITDDLDPGQSPRYGGPVTYTLHVTNNGPDDAASASVIPLVPDRYALGPISRDDGTLSCTFDPTTTEDTCALDGGLAHGVTAVIHLSLTANTTDYRYASARVSVGAPASDSNPNNDYAQAARVAAVGAQARLNLSFNQDPGQNPRTGEPFHFTATVTNTGPDAAPLVGLRFPSFSNLSPNLLSPTAGSCDLAHGSCQLGTVPAGGSTSVALTATSANPGYFVAYVQLDATAVTDPCGYSCYTYVTGYTQLVDLQVTLAPLAGPAPAIGVPFHTTATLTNAGPNESHDTALYFSSYYDVSIDALTVIDSPGACSPAGHDCTFGTLAAGSSVSVDVTLTVHSCCYYGLQVYGSSTGGSDPNGAYASIAGPVTGGADLSVALVEAAGETPTAGQPAHFSATVTNHGPDTATGGIINLYNAYYYQYLSFDSLSGPGSCDLQSLTCQLGDLAAGASATVELTATASQYGYFQLHANVSSAAPDPNGSNNSAQADGLVSAPYPYIVGSSGSPAGVGRTADFGFGVYNYGTLDAAGVALTGTLPADTTFAGAMVLGHPDQGNPCTVDAGGANLRCALGTIPHNSQAWRVIIQLQLGSQVVGTSVALSVAVSSITPGNPGNPIGTSTVTVTDDHATLANAGLSTFYNPVAVGDVEHWQAYVYNNGPATATHFTVTDRLPLGTTLVAMSSSYGVLQGRTPTCRAIDATTNTVACDFGSLVPSDYGCYYFYCQNGYYPYAVVDVEARVEASHSPGDILSNSVSFSGDQAAAVSAPAGQVQVGDDQVNMFVGSQLDGPSLPVVVGDHPIIFDYVYTGTVTPRNPVMSEALPDGVTFTSATISTDGTVSYRPLACTVDTGGTVVTCPLGTLPRNTYAYVKLALSAPGSTAAHLRATASVQADQADAYPADNTSLLTFDVVADQADLGITLGAPSASAVGDGVDFSVAFSNAGPGRANGLHIVDTLPSQVSNPSVSYTSFSDSTGYHNLDCSIAGRVVTCTAPTIGLGGNVSGTTSTYPANGYMSIHATTAATGSMVNSATISSAIAEPAGTGANNTASTTTEVTDPDLAVTITPVRSPVEVGAPYVYRIGVTNHGGIPAQAVQLTNVLPPGDVMSVRSIADQTSAADDRSGFACSSPAPDVSCTLAGLAPHAVRFVEVQVVPAAAGRETTTATVSFSGAGGATEDMSDNSATVDVDAVAATGPNAVRNQPGFVTHTLAGCNYCATPLVALPFTISYFGNLTSGIYIGNDGVVGFGTPNTYPSDPAGGNSRVAVVNGDSYDTTAVHSHKVQYGEGTVDGHQAFAINFVDVGLYYNYYTDYLGAPVNSSQLVIINRPDKGPGAFDLEFNYDHVRFRGGYNCNCYTGGYAGYNPGDGTPGYLLPGSGTNQILDSSGSGLIANTLNAGGQLGRYEFNVGYQTSASDLSAAIAGPTDPVVAGQTLQEHVTIANAGPQDGLANVAVPVPVGTIYIGVSGTVGCSNPSGTVVCSTGTIANGATTSFDLSFAVASTTRGSIPASVTVSAPGLDNNPANNAAITTTAVVTSADISVGYTYQSNNSLIIAPGQTVHDVFYLYNSGPSSANNATIRLDVPVGLHVASTGGGGPNGVPTCTSIAAALDCNFGSLPAAGYYYGAYVDVTLTGVTAGSQTVTANASSDEPDPVSTDNTRTITTQVYDDVVDLYVSKYNARPAGVVGEQSDFYLYSGNRGPSTARGTIVTDVVPPNWRVDGTNDPARCTVMAPAPDGTTTVTCAYGDLGSGANEGVAVHVTPLTPSATPVTNTATVASQTTEDTSPGTYANSSSADGTIAPNVADLGVANSSSRTAMVVGEPDTFYLHGYNNGPAIAYGVTITDPLPANFRVDGVTESHPGNTTGSCATTGQSVTCSYNRLDAGQSVNVQVNVTPQTPGDTVANTATIAAGGTTEPADATAPNSATVSVPVAPNQVDTGAGASVATSPMVVTEPTTLTVYASNFGPAVAHQVTLTDVIPDQLHPTGLANESDNDPVANCTMSGQTLTCNWATLPANATFSATVNVTPIAAGDGITNSVGVTSASSEVTGDGSRPNTASTTFDVKAHVVDLFVSQTASRSPAVAGEPFTLALYTINYGPAVAHNVHVTDDVPADLGPPTTDDTRCSITGQHIDCGYGDLSRYNAAGTTLTVTATEDAVAHSPVINTATATSDTPEASPDSHPNSASVSEPVTAVKVDLGAYNNDDQSGHVFIQTETGTFTIGVTNHGPAIAHGTHLDDIFPSQVKPTRIDGTSPAGAACSITGQEVNCDFGDVANGASAQAQVSVVANGLSPTDSAGQFLSINNTMTASSSSPEVALEHFPNGATDQFFVLPEGIDLVAATTTVAHGHLGEPQHYTLAVQNNSYGTAHGVTLDDTIPANFNVDTVNPPGGTTCTTTGHAIHCDTPTLTRFATVTVDVAVTSTSIANPIVDTLRVAATSPADTIETNNTATVTSEVSRRPTVHLGIDPSSGVYPLGVTAHVDANHPDGEALSYTIYWGDGGQDGGPYSAGLSIQHTYRTNAVFAPTVRVSDDAFASFVSDSAVVSVSLPTPLMANAGPDLATTAGEAHGVTLDGSGSSPADAIRSYRWHVTGPGGFDRVMSGAVVPGVVLHDQGVYTATLVVDAGSGGTATDAAVINVGATAPNVVVTVVDHANGLPLNQADVAIVAQDGTRYSGTTDSIGTAALAGLPDGSYAVFVAKTGYQAGKGSATAAGGGGAVTVSLDQGAIATATLDAHRITPTEAAAAGVDLADPANQNDYKFEINLAFGPTPVVFHGYTSPIGFFGTGFGTGGGGGGCSSTCTIPGSAFGIPGISVVVSVQYVQNVPQIIYITIPGQAKWLKEFYDVTMTVQDLAPAGSGFVLTNGVARLDLPTGPGGASALALPALFGQTQSNPQDFPDVPGGESKSVQWIVRGDLPGLYNLTAHYAGRLDPVGLPVILDATTARPIKVWGLDAAALRITGDDQAFERSPYRVGVQLCNVTNSDPQYQTPIYNVAVQFGEPTQHAIFQPQQKREFNASQIDPGQCLAAPLELIPDFTGTFRPDYSFVRKVADGTVDSTARFFSQAAIPLGDRPTLTVAPTDTGGVDLTWQPVSGATGYTVWATGDQTVTEQFFDGLYSKVVPAPFGTAPRTQTDAATHTLHVDLADGQSAEYAVLPILPANHDMVHPVVQAVAPVPPLGRCPAGTAAALKARKAGDTNCDGKVRVAVLGDSYISGEGAFPPYEPGTADYLPPLYNGLPRFQINLCHRADTSWARLEGIDLASSANDVLFAACSGAVTEDVVSRGQYPRGWPTIGWRTQLDELKDFAASAPVDVVFISIGGNNVGFADIISDCILGPCLSNDGGAWKQRRLDKIKTELPNIADAYAKVRAAATAANPTAEIYAANYPDPVDSTTPPECPSRLALIEAIGGVQFPGSRHFQIDAAEEQWLHDQFIPRLDAGLVLAAQSAGVHLLDFQDALVSDNICQGGVNGIVSGDGTPVAGYGPLGNESFHPSVEGHQLLKSAAQTQLGLVGASPNPDANPDILPQHPQDSITAIAVNGQLFTWSDQPVTTINAGNGEQIVVSLYSSPQIVGEGTAGPDGHLSIPIQIPPGTPPGVHELRAMDAVTGNWIGSTFIQVTAPIDCKPVGPGDDVDGDNIRNSCDPNPNDGPLADQDGDGTPNGVDNCPMTPNPDQANSDNYGPGDACDPTRAVNPLSEVHPVTAPSGPTIVGAIHHDSQVAVTFAVPFDGGSPLTSTTVMLQPGNHIQDVTDGSTEVVVSGLDPGLTYTASVTATNRVGTSAATTAPVIDGAVNVPPAAPTFTAGGPPPSATLGVPYKYLFAATGEPAPAFSLASGTLPAGFTLAATTGALAGTPTETGSFTFSVRATNGTGIDAFTTAADLVVRPPAPALTSSDAATFTVGQAGSFVIRSSGTPTPALSETGALPAGVSFVDNLNSTASLAGTALAGEGGTYQLMLTAHNGAGPDATQPFVLTVNEAPSVATAAAATFAVGTAGTFVVATAATPTASLSETGPLPAGVSFTDNANGTATLSGTPLVASGGTYPMLVTAHNGIGTDATQSFVLTVNESPMVSALTAATFTVGTPGSLVVRGSGTPTPSLTETGALPSGVSFVDNANGTASLSGTPLAGEGGRYLLVITAHNSVGLDAALPFILTVNEAPSVNTANAATFSVGTAGSFIVATSGTPTASLAKTGDLPSGVSFVDNLNGTASVSGTPSAGSGGTYPLVFTAHNGVGSEATQRFVLTVNQAPAITSPAAATFTVGTVGHLVVQSTGFPGAAVTETGVLPAGVSFADNLNGTASLSGTPSAGTGGSFRLVFTARNGVAADATQPFVLTVNERPAITSAASASFTGGVGGSFPVTTSGFPAAALTETGALPGGVTFVDNHNGTAALRVDPTAPAGSTTIEVAATNAAGTTSQTFSLTVSKPITAPVFSASSPPASAIVGSQFSYTYAATGNPMPSFAVGSGTLPTGLSLDRFTGVLSGTPTAAGTFTFAVSASNSAGAVSASAAITVTAPTALTSIAVTPTDASIPAGTSQQYTAVGTYSDGTSQDITAAVTWSVPDGSPIATISAAGLALGQLAGGPITVTATVGSVSGTATLTVISPALTSIAVTPATATIANGTTQQFTATGTFTDGTNQDLSGQASWSSSNTTVATVVTAGSAGSPGIASALAVGSTNVTAAFNGMAGAAKLTVSPATLTRITVAPAAISAAKGTTRRFTAVGTFSDGTTQDLTGQAVWSSSSTLVATVGTAGSGADPGRASALTAGKATISATFNAVSGSATLSVTTATTKSLALTPAKATVPKGATQQFAASASFSDGTTQDVSDVATWTSASPATATASAGGLVRGVKIGGTTITASFSKVTAKAPFTVTAPVPVALRVVPPDAHIAKGLSIRYLATAVMSDGSLQQVTSLTAWSTSSAAVATFKANAATAVGVGQTTVTASYRGLTMSVPLTVTPAILRAIRVAPIGRPLLKGATTQFSATGVYTDASTQDLTARVTWLSSAPTVATITAMGTAKGVARGTTMITTTLGPITTKVRLQVI